MTRLREALGETVRALALDGGAGLAVVPRPGRRCHVVVSIGFGALHEAGAAAGEPDGIAHFLEHRLFEKADGDISERFTDLGADVDAQTGFTATSYSVTCSSAVLAPAVDLLFELAGTPHFPQASVARERSIVGHEIQLFEDNVDWVAFQTLLGALYPGERIAIDIAGTPASLQGIDGTMLEACHARRYHPAVVQILASGPIDADDLARRCDRALRRWPQDGAPPTPLARPTAQPSSRRASLALPRERRLLGFADGVGRGGLDLMRHELAMEMALDILFGPGSVFFTRHYESGLLDGETFGGEVHMDEAFGFCVLGGDTDGGDAMQAAILRELEAAPASDWVEVDFERARRRAVGDMICRWEDVEGAVGFIENARLRGCDPFDVVDLYGRGGVGPADVRRCLDECLRPDRVAVAGVGPG